jgi:xylulokinase
LKPGNCLLGIDLGTSAVKVTALDPERGPIGRGHAEYSIYRPYENYAELEPKEVLEALGIAVHRALFEAHIQAIDINAIGLTGLVPSLIPVDQKHRALGRCMINLDRRAVQEADKLKEDLGVEALVRMTGLVCHPKFGACKILWLQAHHPEIYRQAKYFLQLKDYVGLCLTGKACSDPCTSANLYLYNIFTRNWSPEILDYCQLTPKKLPEIISSTSIIGHITPDASEWSHLNADTPVICGADDTTCEMLANCAYRPGGAFENSGTSSHLMVITDQLVLPVQHDLGHFELSLGLRPGLFSLSYINHATGALLRWLYEIFWNGNYEPHLLTELDVAAAKSPLGSEGLYLMPFVNGRGSPKPNPSARGVIYGLTLQHRRGNFISAFYEGVAYWLRECIDDLKSQQILISDLVVGGGLAESRVWRQIKADVIGLPLLYMNQLESTSLGAALLAGEGSCLFSDAFSIAKQISQVTERSEPDVEAVQLYSLLFSQYQKLCADLFIT